MTSTHPIAVYAHSLFAGIARVLAAGLVVVCAHVAGPLWGQSSWSLGTNITSAPTTANVGIGTTGPLAKFDIQGPSSGNGGRVMFHDNGNYSPYIAMYRWTGAASNYFQTTIGNMIDNNNGALSFQTGVGGGAIGSDTQTTRMIILSSSGNVGIGTTSPQYLLTVKGIIGAREVIVTSTMGADYVFRPEYRLRKLGEVSTYIQAHHHLPEIPSEAEVRANGVSVGDMQMKLLAKIEELTLHAIHADERNNRLEHQNRELQNRMARLERPRVEGGVKAGSGEKAGH